MIGLAAEEPAAMADSPYVLSRLEDLCTSVHLLSKLKHAQSASRGALDAEFSRIGITIPQFLALANIDQNADISSAELARQSFVSPQAMMTIVARLEAAGWIVRTPAAQGGRSLTMRLTEKGAALLKEARAHAYAIERYVPDVLGESAYSQLLTSLDRVADALSAEGTVTTTTPWESYLGEGAARLGDARARRGA